MKVSYQLAKTYVRNSLNFFATREDRNANMGANPEAGTYCAIAENPDIDVTSEEERASTLWYVEFFNGSNWVLCSLDPNYALIITDDGLKALTDIYNGQYLFDVSAVKICPDVINDPQTPISSWTKTNFESRGIILNTNDSNTNFTKEHNIKWKNNLVNAGLQFIITLDQDTRGYLNGQYKDNYTIGSVGFYVKNMNSEQHEDVLFAVGNLNQTINKYGTTANRVGNSVKLYFNLAISNLGYFTDITSFPEDVNSIPEVENENQLETLTDANSNTAYNYNLYLVDNFQNTHIPALALRTPTTINPESGYVDGWGWSYVQPIDDTITAQESDFVGCSDFMAVSWDPSLQKFVPADGGKKLHPSNANDVVGIKIRNNIKFSGSVRNTSYNYYYTVAVAPGIGNAGKNYRKGDTLTKMIGSNLFSCTVTDVTGDNNGVATLSAVNPSMGNIYYQQTLDGWNCVNRQARSGGDEDDKVQIRFTSIPYAERNYVWNFPASWRNKPLYADYNHVEDTEQEWTDYCDNVLELSADSPERNNKDRRGKLTIVNTEYFIGWCDNTGAYDSVLQLALDLRNEATYTDYGTTRYATNDEVSNVVNNAGTSEITSVNPKLLNKHYLQRTAVAGNPGESYTHPVEVTSHVQFKTAVIGRGINTAVDAAPSDDVSFYGIAYRAKWADLAEFYESDKLYPEGTLITIGAGDKEITIAKEECNGVISSKPGYELGEKKTPLHLPVALVGKVPVRFDSKCMPRFGDRVFMSRFEDGKASTNKYGFCLGKIIDKRPNLDRCETVLCSIRISF